MATNKCAHAGCKCDAPAGQQFCSDHCAQAKGAANAPGGCGCNHPHCRH